MVDGALSDGAEGLYPGGGRSSGETTPTPTSPDDDGDAPASSTGGGGFRLYCERM